MPSPQAQISVNSEPPYLKSEIRITKSGTRYRRCFCPLFGSGKSVWQLVAGWCLATNQGRKGNPHVHKGKVGGGGGAGPQPPTVFTSGCPYFAGVAGLF